YSENEGRGLSPCLGAKIQFTKRLFRPWQWMGQPGQSRWRRGRAIAGCAELVGWPNGDLFPVGFFDHPRTKTTRALSQSGRNGTLRSSDSRTDRAAGKSSIALGEYQAH